MENDFEIKVWDQGATYHFFHFVAKIQTGSWLGLEFAYYYTIVASSIFRQFTL